MIHDTYIYKKFFNDKHNNIKKYLFFSCDDIYWYTRQKSFNRLFEIITIELGIINFDELQNDKTERIKLELLEQAKYIGNMILKNSIQKYFKKEGQMKELYRNYFYLRKDSAMDFIRNVVSPLIKMISNKKKYKWVNLENKNGFWRELGDNETMPIGSEISMNFKMGKNYIKLG